MSHIPPPGPELLIRVRQGFIGQRKTLGEWCRKQRPPKNPSNVRQAILGAWDGPKGQALRDNVIHAAGLRRTS